MMTAMPIAAGDASLGLLAFSDELSPPWTSAVRSGGVFHFIEIVDDAHPLHAFTSFLTFAGVIP